MFFLTKRAQNLSKKIIPQLQSEASQETYFAAANASSLKIRNLRIIVV